MEIRWSLADAAPLPPGAPPAMQQHPSYGAACAVWGRRVMRAEIRADGAVVGTALALARGIGSIGAALVSRGPVWANGAEDAAKSAALRALARDLPVRGLGALLLTPDHGDAPGAMHAAGLVQVQTPLHVAEIDLTGPAAERRAAQTVKWRNRLTRAEGEGLKVRRAALLPDPGHWLLRAEAAQQRARGYRGLPPAFGAAWASAAPGDAQVFSVDRKGAPIAAMLVLIHAPTASYHIGWSDEEGRRLNAHQLILWRMSDWLARRGIVRLDLGAVDTEDAPGLARFKIGAGAAIRALPGAWLGAPGTAFLARLQRG
ncbi:MAG: hypothetical protein ACJA1L_000901 [Paracoccaceae bacterium]|jgi:hypothetical protein